MSIEPEDLKKVFVGKDDTLVVKVDSTLRKEELERIKGLMLSAFPDNNILILDRAIPIEVLTPSEAS